MTASEARSCRNAAPSLTGRNGSTQPDCHLTYSSGTGAPSCRSSRGGIVKSGNNSQVPKRLDLRGIFVVDHRVRGG